MTLGSLTQLSYMNGRLNTMSQIPRITCYNRCLKIKTKIKYSFLTTSGECYCLVHIRFPLLLKVVVMQLMSYACVRSFQFILLEIQIERGIVTVLDSRRKDPQD